MVSMQFDPDFGWIPVDAQGNFDVAADAAINAERAARGIDVRDPGMMYRPDVTKTLGATPGQPATYTAGFGQIADPLITLANLAKAPGAIGRETGNVGSGADALMKAIQVAAQGMAEAGQPDPLAAALATQGLTPSYEEEPVAPVAPVAPVTGPQEGDERTDDAGNTYTFTNGAWTQTGTGEGRIEGDGTPLASEWTPGYAELWRELNGGSITDVREIDRLISAGGFTPEEKAQLAERAAIAIMNGAPAGSDMEAVQIDLESIWNKFVAPHSGAQPGQFTDWASGMGWTVVDSSIDQEATGLGSLGDVQPGQDVGAYWASIFEGTFAGTAGGSWESKIDSIATALYKNPDVWASRPGMAGLNPENFTLQEIKQWLTDTAWGSIPEAERTRLTGAYGGNSPVPGMYDIKGAPSAAAPSAAAPGAAAPGATAPGAQPGAQPSGPTPVTGPGGVPVPTPSVTPRTIEEMLGMYVDPAGERSFSEIYPGFAASQAGYGMPTVQQAYQQAAAPLQTQYSMQLPNLLKNVPGDVLSGTGMNYQTPQEFLQSLASGGGRVLGGSDLFGSLQNIGQALSMDPTSQSFMGMDPNQQLKTEMYQSLFGKPAQQISAFAQPFLMATRGAPEARKALTDAISRAGARFGYQNPLGVDGQSFLPWALEQNLMGIKGMFTPGSTRQNPGWQKPLATAPGVFSQQFWDSPQGMKRQEVDLDLGI